MLSTIEIGLKKFLRISKLLDEPFNYYEKLTYGFVGDRDFIKVHYILLSKFY